MLARIAGTPPRWGFRKRPPVGKPTGIPTTSFFPSDAVGAVEGLLLERDDATLQINIRGRIKRLPRDRVLSVRLTTPG